MRKCQGFNLFFSNDLASACALEAQQTAAHAVCIYTFFVYFFEMQKDAQT